MTRHAVEKKLLRQTFQLFASTIMLGTESLNASDRCQGQPPLKREVTDLAKWHYLSVATHYRPRFIPVFPKIGDTVPL